MSWIQLLRANVPSCIGAAIPDTTCEQVWHCLRKFVYVFLILYNILLLHFYHLRYYLL